MVTHFINESKRKHKKVIGGNARAVRLPWVACKRAKRDLSSSASASTAVDQLCDSTDFPVALASEV